MFILCRKNKFDISINQSYIIHFNFRILLQSFHQQNHLSTINFLFALSILLSLSLYSLAHFLCSFLLYFYISESGLGLIVEIVIIHLPSYSFRLTRLSLSSLKPFKREVLATFAAFVSPMIHFFLLDLDLRHLIHTRDRLEHDWKEEQR